MKKEIEKCYYNDYSVCTLQGSQNYENRCNNCTECEHYITENHYFMAMMNGEKLPEVKISEQKATKKVDHKKLELGKSKKALKKEAKMEAEKNPPLSGFSLMDDPRFKDLFRKK